MVSIASRLQLSLIHDEDGCEDHWRTTVDVIAPVAAVPVPVPAPAAIEGFGIWYHLPARIQTI